MLPMNPSSISATPTPTRCAVPVVKLDIHKACAPLWEGRSLFPHQGELERLLMIDADAALVLDALPSRDAMSRSFDLLDVLKKSFSGNQQLLSGMVKRVGGALKDDRIERGAKADDTGIQADLETITRTVAVTAKPQWRPAS